MPTQQPNPNPRLAADLLFDRLHKQLINTRHKHTDVHEATQHLFWRIHNSYNSIRFLHATDPRTFTLIDQYSIIRCVYEALVNLEYICAGTGDETLLRATQFTLHINVLLEKELLKNIPRLQSNIQKNIMSFFSRDSDGAIELLQRKAQQWRENNFDIHGKYKPDLLWHGNEKIADIALHHDEQYFMHTVFHHAIHSNYVPISSDTYTPEEITTLSVMIFARAFQALFHIHNIQAPEDDKNTVLYLCRPLDQQFNAEFDESGRIRKES